MDRTKESARICQSSSRNEDEKMMSTKKEVNCILNNDKKKETGFSQTGALSDQVPHASHPTSPMLLTVMLQ